VYAAPITAPSATYAVELVHLGDFSAQDEHHRRVIDPEYQDDQGGQRAVHRGVIGDVGHVPGERPLEQLPDHRREGGRHESDPPRDPPVRQVAVDQHEHQEDEPEGEQRRPGRLHRVERLAEVEPARAVGPHRFDQHRDGGVRQEERARNDHHLHVVDLPPHDAAVFLDVEDVAENRA
jgi:hypothetical protein